MLFAICLVFLFLAVLFFFTEYGLDLLEFFFDRFYSPRWLSYLLTAGTCICALLSAMSFVLFLIYEVIVWVIG